MMALMLMLAAEPAYIMAQVVDTSGGVCEINRGTQWGIAKGQTVGFYDVWQSGKIWAVGVVDSVESLRAFVKPKYHRKPSPGQLVQIKVQLKGSGWNDDPILSIGRLYIGFKDDSGHTMFFPDDVMDTDSLWRGQLLQDMLQSVRAMAEYTGDVLVNGKDTLSLLLSRVETKDITAFLEFVADFPAGYMGRELSFPGAYATWVKNGSPPSGKRLAKMLEQGNEETRKQLLSKYRPELAVALDWLVRWGKKDLALQLAQSTKDQKLIKLVKGARSSK